MKMMQQPSNNRVPGQIFLKPDMIVFMLCGLAIALSVLFSTYQIVSLIAVIASILYVFAILKGRPAFIFKYLYWFFISFLALAGVLSIELTDIDLSRLSVTAHFVGSTPLLALAYWFFFAALLSYDYKFGVERLYRDERSCSGTDIETMKNLTYLTLAMVLFCLCFVITNPSFLSGFNRFQYIETQLPGIARYTSRVLEFMIVIPILYFKHTKSRMPLITVALYCIYLFFINTKFGMFFSIFTIIVLVYYDRLALLSNHSLRNFVYGAALLVLGLVCVAALSHSFTSNVSTSDYLAERLAGQGEMWWRTYELLDGESHPDQFRGELAALLQGKTGISDNVGSNYGIYRIMYFTSPKSTVDSVLSQGWRFTEAGYAAAFYYFGGVGVITFALLAGILVAFVQNCLLRAIWFLNSIKSAVLIYFVGQVKTAISMFLFVGFLRPISLIFFLYLLFERLLSHQSTIQGALNPHLEKRV